VNDRTDAILASIDGALMDPEIPDGMRWSPAPERVCDPDAVPYDGAIVPIPHQTYEPGSWGPPADRRPQSHAQGTGQGVSRSLPPGGSMLLGQLRADHARLSEERAHLIAEGVPASALVQPLDPDVRVMAPRVSDHTPRRGEGGLLIVEEYASGLISVRRASPEETAEVVRQTWAHLVEAFRPMVEQVGEAFRSMGDTLRSAGLATEQRVRRDLDTEEGRRAAALDARRHRHTGPPPLGPERSRRPRTHR
jgi:hypothetical protein